ncbi:MAG: hypothetical protein AB8B61_01335 [Cyclobacteriaceae bacterium]
MRTDIEKETIDCYNFPNTDVLSEENLKKNRKRNIEKAMRLGNSLKHKVKINFNVTNKPYSVSVKTTIWAVDEHFIFLKGAKIVPIKSIESIEI